MEHSSVPDLSERDLEDGLVLTSSWHDDHRSSPTLKITGIDAGLTEGDLLVVFSEFGTPIHINIIRDVRTGASRGIAFLQYADQRSTDLAVDNLNGVRLVGSVLSVSHFDGYTPPPPLRG